MPENEGAEVNLSDLSKRDEVWDVRKTMAQEVQMLYAGTEFDQYSPRMQRCGGYLEFANRLLDESTGERAFKLTGAHFCRVRYCPLCQWRKTLRWVHRALRGLPQIKEDYPKARWIFLTLTVKNVPIAKLRTTVKSMNKAFDRLTKRKHWKPVLGWSRSLEVTKSADGEAHPHFHILMMVKPGYFTGRSYVKQSEWREVWKACLKADYLPVVNVKTVKPKPGSAEPVEAAIRETFKYAVKPADLAAEEDWLVELTKQMHQMRSINIGGVLRKYWSADEPKTDEDMINVGDDDDHAEVSDDDPRLCFGWRERKKRYVKVNRDV